MRDWDYRIRSITVLSTVLTNAKPNILIESINCFLPNYQFPIPHIISTLQASFVPLYFFSKTNDILTGTKIICALNQKPAWFGTTNVVS
jgi:hypothetical protein